MRPDSSVHWSSYPALLLGSVFGGGIVVETAASAGVGVWLSVAGTGVVTWMGAVLWEGRRIVTLGPLLRVAALAILAVAAGGARQAAYDAASPRDLRLLFSLSHADSHRMEDATLTGIVIDAPVESGGTWRFTLEVDSVRSAFGSVGVDGRVRTTLHNPLWISTTAYPDVRQGDRLRLTGALSPAPRPRNPGAFDYAAYLARRGVCCTMYVDDDAQVEVVGHMRGTLSAFIVASRDYVRRQIHRYVSGPSSQAVLRALLLGDRSGLGDAEKNQFASTGLMHLLAVSGLHVLLVGMVLYGLLRPLLMRVRLDWKTVEITRAAVTIAVLGFYVLLTGTRPSVVRAVVMAVVVIGGLLTQRSPHALNSLGVAGVILLAIRPPMLFDAGFQLSMSAVAGIVSLNPVLHGLLASCVPETWRERSAVDWLVSMITVSASATLGTGPVLLHHFGQVAVAGLILNVIAIPLTAVALTAGILCVAVGEAVPALGAAFGASADVVVRGLLEVARWGADWLSWGIVSASSPGRSLLFGLGAGLVAAVQWERPRARWWMMGAALGCLCVATWGQGAGRLPGRPVVDLVFLDVGQGDAALLSTPSGRHVLVDAGPRTQYSDAGRRTVLPYLQSRGISRLDAVVITHPDSDHLGGLPSILRGISVKRVLHSGRQSDTQLYAESRHLLDSLQVPHRAVTQGGTITVDPSVGIQVLGPAASRSGSRAGSDNDASVVVRITYGSTSFLLTGDVEAAGESQLVEAYGRKLTADVVKVPHHGSSTSSGQAFVDSVSRLDGSTHAVVSVGQRNAFGLPDVDVLSRWQGAQSQLHLTPQRGAVWMRSDGYRVWRVVW